MTAAAAAAQEAQFHQQANHHHRSKNIEWDTNFSGQWEMGERDPIKEFLNAQRGAGGGGGGTTSDSESMASVQLRDDGYDNVFKMRRSDVNEEQTMLIKSFLQPKMIPTNTNQSQTKTANNKNEATFGFNLVETEEYFNLISPIQGAAAANDGSGASPSSSSRGGRLFDRRREGAGPVVANAVTAESLEDEMLSNSEFDAKLDAFKAKFDTNIRNLWSQNEEDEVDGRGGGVEESLQPMSLNSFWQNYNKHFYDFPEGSGSVGGHVTGGGGAPSLDGNNNNHPQQQQLQVQGEDVPMMNGNGVGGGGGWFMGNSAGAAQENMNTFQQQQQQQQEMLGYCPDRQQSMTIWSNNELNDCHEQVEVRLQEHMAAAYQKQLEMGFGMVSCIFLLSIWRDFNFLSFLPGIVEFGPLAGEQMGHCGHFDVQWLRHVAE